MQCRECKKLLSQFLDHQLDARREALMREHMEKCPGCGRALASLTEMVSLLHGLREVNPPADFIKNVNARLDIPTLSLWQKLQQALWRAPISLRVATVMATLVLAVYVTNQTKTIQTGRMEEQPAFLAKKNAVSVLFKEETPAPEAPAALTQQSQNGNEKRSLEAAQAPIKADNVYAPQERAEQIAEAEPKDAFPLERAVNQKARTVSRKSPEKTSLPAASNAPSPETSLIAGSITVEEEQSALKENVIKLNPGNLIAANREQDWTLVSSDGRPAEQALTALLADMQAFDIMPVEEQDNTAAMIYRFSIRFRQVSLLAERCEQLGTVTYNTPFPVVRPEAYTGALGIGNPLVPEEVISIQITLQKPRK